VLLHPPPPKKKKMMAGNIGAGICRFIELLSLRHWTQTVLMSMQVPQTLFVLQKRGEGLPDNCFDCRYGLCWQNVLQKQNDKMLTTHRPLSKAPEILYL